MGETLDQDAQKVHVHVYSSSETSRCTCAPVSGQLHVVQAAPEGIVTARERNLLIENGGHIHEDIALTRGWTISILK